MSRSFRQLTDGQLRVLEKTTRDLAALSAARSYNKRRLSQRDRQADSDFDRYSRCARWVDREIKRRAAL